MSLHEVPEIVTLPEPCHDGAMSLEATLCGRESVRAYASRPLSLPEVSQLLWAAQGLTHPDGRRTVPSAGALYPLEVYLIAGRVADIEPGLYRYRLEEHDLAGIAAGNLLPELADAALGQECVEGAAAAIVIAAVFDRTAGKYGERAGRYVYMEVGHVAQNVLLQATALDLGTVLVGAFEDDRVARALRLPPTHVPVALMPVGGLSR